MSSFTPPRPTLRRRGLYHHLPLFSALCGLLGASASAFAADSNVPAFSQLPPGVLPPPWHFASLPNKKPTRFDIVELEGHHVLRVSTDDSYGNLVHARRLAGGEPWQLTWKWRLDKPLEHADLRQRSGDDAALKVCVSFDFDVAKLSFGERTKLRLGSISTGESIPAETLCYVWDRQLPTGTVLNNAFTQRLRFVVLQNSHSPIAQWLQEKRDLRADYQRAFGDESPQAMPDIIDVSISADADSTHGTSLGYVGDLHLQLKP